MSWHKFNPGDFVTFIPNDGEVFEIIKFAPLTDSFFSRSAYVVKPLNSDKTDYMLEREFQLWEHPTSAHQIAGLLK